MAFAERAWPAIAAFAIVIGGWELAVRAYDVPSYLIPAPSAIWTAMWFDGGSIFGEAGITALEAVVGFVIGSLFGAVLGTV
jgi:NitT/TauT family transport system permease protein